MRSIQRRGLNNSLIRWVHRHNRIATLFRSPSPGAQVIPPVRRFPAVSEAYPESFQDTRAQQNEEKPQTPSARSRIAAQTPTKSNPVFARTQIPSAGGKALASVSSEQSTETSESSDQEWKRLQAIFRKHQEPAGTKASSIVESNSMDEEAQRQSTSPGSLSDPEQPGPKHAETQHPQSVLRKPQAQAEEKPALIQKARTSQTFSARSGLRRDQSPENMGQPEGQHGPPWPSIQARGQQPQEGDSDATLRRTTPPSKSVPAGSSGIAEKHETVARENQESHSPGIQRGLEEPARTKLADISDSAASQRAPAEPVTHEGLDQPQAQQGQVQQVHPIQLQRDASPDKQRPGVIQRVWQGMGAIFRKQQEPAESRTAGIQRSTKSFVEPEITDSQRPRDMAEQSTESNDKPEIKQATPPVPPTPRSDSSREPVQRFQENIERNAGSDQPQMIAKSQARFSLAAEQEPVTEAESKETNPSSRAVETTLDLPDQAPESDHLPQQPVPLQDVWNVQRLEDTQFETDESGSILGSDTVMPAQSVYPREPAAAVKRMAFDEEKQSAMESDRNPSPSQSSFDGSRAPVEILPPSRPRPSAASVIPSRPAVQRQAENRHGAAEIHEPTLVDTAIGPLPSDLWSLLGQKPPVSSGPRDVQRQPSSRASSEESPGNQETYLNEYTMAPAERTGPTSHPPAVLQRQVESSVPSTGSEQGAVSPSEQDEKASTEPDLQDLAQKVYAEVRRRLATESERTHRYI